MRTLKTDLKPEDLQKPIIDIEAADQAGAGSGTASGALLLPENQDIAKQLNKAPVIAVDNDWMKKGDPLAPALQELEDKARAAREEAERQARAAAAMPPAQPMAMPLEAAGPTPGTHEFPWQPEAPSTDASTAPDEVDDFAHDMGVSLDAPTEAGAPVEAARVPVAAVPPVESSNGEVVLHIQHDPDEFMRRVADSAKRLAKEEKHAATGATVVIDHDQTMDSLPYTPPAKHYDHRKAA